MTETWPDESARLALALARDKYLTAEELDAKYVSRRETKCWCAAHDEPCPNLAEVLVEDIDPEGYCLRCLTGCEE